MKKSIILFLSLIIISSCKKIESKDINNEIMRQDSTSAMIKIDSSKLETIQFLFKKANEKYLDYFESVLHNPKNHLLDTVQYYYEKVLEIDSSNFTALRGLLDVNLERKESEKAIFYGKKIWNKSPNAKYFHELVVYQVHKRLNNEEEARKALQRGLSLINDRKKQGNIEDIQLLLLEQTLNMENGMIDLAYKELLELDKRFPNNKEIKTTLNAIKFLNSKE